MTGNSYREPALLAKMITTLDLVSGGRALLGLGELVRARASQRLAKEVLPLGADGLIVGIQDADRHPSGINLAAKASMPLLARSSKSHPPRPREEVQ